LRRFALLHTAARSDGDIGSLDRPMGVTKMMIHNGYRSLIVSVLVGLASMGLSLAGCSPEFTDQQCQSDNECFPDEVCTEAGFCRDRGLYSDTGVDGGVDAEPDVADAEPDATPPQIDYIEVTPTEADLALGLTVTLTAQAFDENGDTIDGMLFEWESDDESVATVDDRGEVRGEGLGEVTISASSVLEPDVFDFAEITVVEGDISRVVVEPDSETIYVGETASFSATAYNEADIEVNDPDIVWSVDDDGVAEVDQDGVVSGLAEGSTTVTANVQGVEDSADVTVELVPVERVEVTADETSVEVGQTIELSATAYDVDDNELSGRTVSWSSDDDTIASVDDGTVTGEGVGAATITAEIGGETGQLEVDVIAANTAPTADAGADATVAVDTQVDLDATNSSDNEDAIGDLSFEWAFIDDPSGGNDALDDINASTPQFTPTSTGVYVLEVTVTDSGSLTDTATVTITSVGAPTADAGSDDTVGVSAQADLDGSASQMGDQATTIDYQWSFTSVPSASALTDLTDDQTATPSFVPDEAGDYVVELVVTNDVGLDDTATVTITAAAGPTADAGADEAVALGDAATLDGSASQPGGGSSVDYQWSFTSVPTASALTALTDDQTAAPSFTPDEAGDYVVELEVTNDLGTSDTDSITVTAVGAPTADAGSGDTVAVGAQVDLDGSASQMGDGATSLDYAWSFTSVPTASALTALTDDQTAAPSFVPDEAGDYVVELEVTNDVGSTDTATVTITAVGSPTADAGADDTATVATQVDLDGSASQMGDGATSLDYAWSFTSVPTNSTLTDLTDAQTATPSFTPDEVGDYVIELEVTNDVGLADTATVTITAQ
jgi:large repetitive protein